MGGGVFAQAHRARMLLQIALSALLSCAHCTVHRLAGACTVHTAHACCSTCVRLTKALGQVAGIRAPQPKQHVSPTTDHAMHCEAQTLSTHTLESYQYKLLHNRERRAQMYRRQSVLAAVVAVAKSAAVVAVVAPVTDALAAGMSNPMATCRTRTPSWCRHCYMLPDTVLGRKQSTTQAYTVRGLAAAG
jgi:hypothetical protein